MPLVQRNNVLNYYIYNNGFTLRDKQSSVCLQAPYMAQIVTKGPRQIAGGLSN
jgi:hypothetical protein